MSFESPKMPATGDWRTEVSKFTANALTAAPTVISLDGLTPDNADGYISSTFNTEITPPINDALRRVASTFIRFGAPRTEGSDADGRAYWPNYTELSTGSLVVGVADMKVGGSTELENSSDVSKTVAPIIRASLSRTDEGVQWGYGDHLRLAELCVGTDEPKSDKVTDAFHALSDLLSTNRYKLEITAGLVVSDPQSLRGTSGVARMFEAQPQLSRGWRKVASKRHEPVERNKLAKHCREILNSKPEVDVWMTPIPLFTSLEDLNEKVGVIEFGVPRQPYYGQERGVSVVKRVDQQLAGPRAQVENAKIISGMFSEIGMPLRRYDFATAARQ
jgi:hypothetical protein